MGRVLVPLDGSSRSEAALRSAMDLFSDAEIFALHVVQITELPDDETESAMDIARGKAHEVLERAKEIARDRGREIETDSEEGHAAKAIVSYAERNDIDHIVMSSTGRSGIRRLLLGSVAESVIRRAPCSVTIVREE